MGNGDRSGVGEGKEKVASTECDVGLGLRMQRTESIPPSEGMIAMHHYHHHGRSSEIVDGVVGDDGGGGRGGSVYCSLSNQVACSSDIYDVVVGASASASGGAAAAAAVPRTFTPDSSFKSSGGGGGMTAPARVAFTASQWKELERQTTIYKYLMASMPIPSELLLPISKSPPLPASQSNISGLDLRFSRNSDPEPWRCRRTDGKKWRCSRDAAPYQKYCERHAHKSRPRSRKHVELQPHNSNNNNINNKNNTPTARSPVNLPANSTTGEAFQKSIFYTPTPMSGARYGQPRCKEWFEKGDSFSGYTFNQQWQQLIQSSSREELKTYGEEHDKSVSVFPHEYHEEQETMNTNSYISMDDKSLGTQQPNDQCCSLLGPKTAYLEGGSTTYQAQMTRRFIDDWSSREREEIDETTSKCSVSSSGKLPLSYLNLSMSGGNGIGHETANAQMGLGIEVDPEGESMKCFRPQWLYPVQWMGSPPPPGGPLGEAMCLGIANTANAAGSNVASPHGYSTTTTTTTSSCSKGSCEDSSHGLHFH